jgi:signal recognition particle subunit SEC65
MDTIASGLEASPWGFDAFGYRPFVQATPENSVHALARYWEVQVSQAVAWRDDHADTCFVIRYEDLVYEPAATVTGLFGFLEVDVDLAVTERGFEKYSAASGPGDYKLAFTRAIDSSSVGRGKRVPIRLIAPPLLERINEVLAKLGYSEIGESWNFEPKRETTAADAARAELRRLMSVVRPGEWTSEVERIGIIADDDVNLRWVVAPGLPSVSAGDGDVDLVIAGATEDLIRMIKGANIGALLREGVVRQMAADPDVDVGLDIPMILTALVQRLDGNRT